MSLADKLKEIGEEIRNDAGVRGGVVQTLANITRIVIRHITHRELPPQSESKELVQRR